MLILKVKNPNMEKEYSTNEVDLDRWKVFIGNLLSGNEYIFAFNDIKTKRFVTINPINFSSVEAFEVK